MPKEIEKRKLIAALDIGTSKTVVLVGEARPDGSLEVIGVGMHDSSGMKNGMVINIDAVVGSIRRALVDAELMAGCKIHKVYSSITGNHIRSSNAHGMVKIKDSEVSQADIEFVIEAASSISLPSDQQVLHILEQEFCLDGQEGIRKPLGMRGRRLGVDVHIVTGAVAAAQNITKCVQCCGLEVSKVILQTLASSKAVLSDDDKELGVCLIDIGGGTANVAIFTQGAIRHTTIIPIAGDQITNDIAKALRTTTKDAEDIKIKYGCALSRLADDNHIEVPDVGEQGNRIVPRQILAEIIEPRVKELYKLVHTELLRSGHYDLLNAGIVITGGGSTMHGMVELVEEIFHLPVRMGIPCCVGRLSDAVKTPQFSTAVGLLMYGLEDIELNVGQISHDAKQDPLFEAVKQLVIETRTPSISFVQRTFRINYSRAASMLEALEGEIVSTKNENGCRRMLTGETKENDGVVIYSPDLADTGMRNFDGEFFNELAELDAVVTLNENDSTLMPPRDGFRLRLSELYEAGKISEDFVRVTREFAVTLAKRSCDRYELEMDFRVRPNQVYSYIQGRSGRKQLYIGFDAIPPPGRKHCCPWGASIGLGFDFRNEHGIITECVNDYEEFISKVCKATVLFDATFGKLGLGGYREPANEFWESEPVTADKTWKYPVDITQNWLFFGRRFTPEAITGMGSLDDFVDECIRVFDVICEGGYYHVGNKLPPHKHRINPSLSFDNFVTGKSNELAHAAALDVVESPGMTYNPLFIYGGVGLGRTHLLHAIGNEFKLKSPQARICYVHATNFVSDVVRAFKTKKFDEFKIFYNSLDLLLFDDIQYISDKPGTQQELCYALNSLIGNNKQVVITCDTTPTEIYGITPRLRSRFSGGLTVAVEPPDLEMRVAILLNKSASNNNPIGEDVAYFVAKHVRADIGEDIRKLEGVLKRIAAFALFHHRPITVDLVKEALAAERSYLEDDRA